jgi:hypothetical protein
MKFASPEAELRRKTSLKRLTDAYRLQEPDRVPVAVSPGMLPLYSNGVDFYTAIYEQEKTLQAIAKFNEENNLELDGFVSSGMIPASVFDILDYKQYAYPGHGIPKSGVGFQYVEGEYMKPDEYDTLIRDPSDFWLRTFLPRVFGVLQPFTLLNPLTNWVEIPLVQLNVLAVPEAQAALLKLIEAGNEQSDPTPSASVRAPFDLLGDTLRGTRGIMMDIFRQPDHEREKCP